MAGPAVPSRKLAAFLTARLVAEAIRRKGKEMPKGIPMRRRDNVLTYLKHHITNTVTEGLNSKIQSLKAAARGFCSFRNQRIWIPFFCGKRIPTIIPEESQ